MTPRTQRVIRGVVAIVFGVLALIWPGVTVVGLALLFGAYAFVDGVTAVAGYARSRYPRRRVTYLVTGIVGIVAGVVTLIWPGITVLALAVMIGVWAVVTGALGLWVAIAGRRRRWTPALLGTAAIVAGLLVLIWPAIGAVTIARVVGIYAIVAGALILAGTRLDRRSPSRQRGGRAAPAGA
jgi:uncharacterized membrane protein HdeD (DUF308 family)